jgi:asparagine synthase (glutamine-hydrolysing)
MCGIVGFIHKKNAFNIETAIDKMVSSISHRGPDDQGLWGNADIGIALGHRRLSIIDLSPLGHQPMFSASGRYVIVFNGEIYNYRELKQRFSSYAYKGHSDTEVILAAVEAIGVDQAVQAMIGMFAFALWDIEAETLYLGRDRMGEKPLYYGWHGGAFLFASELKALASYPDWQGQVDRQALHLFFRNCYIPAPYSIYENIHKLIPGTLLKLTKQDIASEKLPAPMPYWSVQGCIEYAQKQPFKGNDQDAAIQLETLLKDAIGYQMIADVPLGAFLSGGIDSSLIVALMQNQSNQPVKTFTIGFEEQQYNEAIHAKAVAAHLKTDHTELYVTPKQTQEVIPLLPQLYDEPFADSSQIPTYLVSKLARESVTVSLSGDAGDELFGGYNRYLVGQKFDTLNKWVAPSIRRLISGGIQRIPPDQWDALYLKTATFMPSSFKMRLPGDKLHKFASILGKPSIKSFYDRLTTSWTSDESIVLTGESFQDNDHPILGNYNIHSLEWMMYWDQLGYLPDDILAKVDRAAMGVSLETRIPFLDHRVIEFAWRLPLSMKIRKGQSKWILRQILYNYVPKALIERPKMGFGVPLNDWLRGPLRDWAEALLNEHKLYEEGYLNVPVVRQKWAEHLSGKRNWDFALWAVLMFESWLETQQ